MKNFFWKWVVEITDPPRKRIKGRGNDTKLATDHNSREKIKILSNKTLGVIKGLR